MVHARRALRGAASADEEGDPAHSGPGSPTLPRNHIQEIMIEIGSRLRDMLSRGKVALPPRPERLLQALDDQEGSHSRGSCGGDRSN
jgi:hypothetical protein